jgi:cytoskeletal protein CcmA (bactofilin family)
LDFFYGQASISRGVVKMNSQHLHALGYRIPISSCYSVPAQPLPHAPKNKGTQKKDRSGKLIIGEGLFVKGQLDACKSLFVQGSLETSVECEVLKVSDNGELKGNAIVDEADIYGLFDGKLSVKGRLTVHAKGTVLGKVRYGELRVERGGIVSGDVKASQNANTPTPSLFQRACLPALIAFICLATVFPLTANV